MTDLISIMDLSRHQDPVPTITYEPGTPVYREGGYGGTSGPGVILRVTDGRHFRTGTSRIPECLIFVYEDRRVTRAYVFPVGSRQGVGWYTVRGATNRASGATLVRLETEGNETVEAERTARREAVREADEERAAAKIAARRIPAWANGALVAVHREDESDSMTDYFASRPTRTILLAWSRHTRNLFPEMRKAARHRVETRHLATAGKEAEHRENYSMGAGYYLQDGGHHRTGWEVSKLALSWDFHWQQAGLCILRGEVSAEAAKDLRPDEVAQ